MEMTLSNLMVELMQGYAEEKVITFKVTREEHIKGSSDTVRTTVRVDEETLMSFTIIFDGKESKYTAGKPRSYYDEQDYEELMGLLKKVRC